MDKKEYQNIMHPVIVLSLNYLHSIMNVSAHYSTEPIAKKWDACFLLTEAYRDAIVVFQHHGTRDDRENKQVNKLLAMVKKISDKFLSTAQFVDYRGGSWRFHMEAELEDIFRYLDTAIDLRLDAVIDFSV